MKLSVLVALLILLLTACDETVDTPIEDVDYRQEMRQLVINLSTWSKTQQSEFIVIPQNGQELVTETGEGNSTPQTDYLNAIDATGRESMFYGYYADDQETPEEDKQHLIDLCVLCESHGVEVLATDYCSTQSKVDDSFTLNDQYGFISFAADQRDLNNIPSYPDTLYNENGNDILNIADAQNFLYLINSENFSEKQDFINTVNATNYDLIIMDLFHNELSYTAAEIESLKVKANGGSRLVVCYMSIGEAEDYRYYWQTNWLNSKPVWLDAENPDWAGNYKVRYWENEWQDIIYGNSNSYLQLILNTGFDGVYLDIIDGFEYYEEN